MLMMCRCDALHADLLTTVYAWFPSAIVNLPAPGKHVQVLQIAELDWQGQMLMMLGSAA